MKTRVLLFVLLALSAMPVFAQLGVNSDGTLPNSSAMLDVKSTVKGILIPRMTIAERNLIVSPATGLTVFCTDNNHYYTNKGTPGVPNWILMSSPWDLIGTNVFYMGGNVGIGYSSPVQRLQVAGNVASDFGSSISPSYTFNNGSENTGFSSPNSFQIAFINNGSMSALFDANGRLGIGTGTPAPTSLLDVTSTTRGVLLPRMTSAQRSAIGGPATGLMVYQTDGTSGFHYYDGGAWQRFGTSSNDYWLPNGSDIYYSAGKVAIGSVTNPDFNGLYVQNYTGGRGAVIGTDQNGLNIYASGYLGVLTPGSLGVPVSVTNAGVLGIKPNLGNNGAAIYGWNNDDNSENYAGLFASDGAGTTNYGVYAMAKNGTSANYAGRYLGRVLIEGHTNSTDAVDYLSPVFSSQVKHTVTTDTRAVEGISKPQPGWGIGAYGEGGYMGMYGVADATTYTGSAYGVYGYATGTAGYRYGIYGYAYGGNTSIGVYGTAYGGTSNWAAYLDGSTYISSDLRIGTTTQATGYIVSVNGKIACEEVLVQDMVSWPDYVFSRDYKLMDLKELENSIQKDNHLPGMPSAQEVKENGVSIGDMQKRLLEKVEELTLHLIQQNKQIETLQKEVSDLKSENASIKKSLRNSR